MISSGETGGRRLGSPKISWSGATAVEANCKGYTTTGHEGASRHFGVDLTWRTWRDVLADELPSAALELPNLRRWLNGQVALGQWGG